MRFDNPIHNHCFKKFTDIASYHELNKEYRNNRNIDLKPLGKALKIKILHSLTIF